MIISITYIQKLFIYVSFSMCLITFEIQVQSKSRHWAHLSSFLSFIKYKDAYLSHLALHSLLSSFNKIYPSMLIPALPFILYDHVCTANMYCCKVQIQSRLFELFEWNLDWRSLLRIRESSAIFSKRNASLHSIALVDTNIQ